VRILNLSKFSVGKPPSSSFDVGRTEPDVYGVAFLPGSFTAPTTFGKLVYNQPLTTWDAAVASPVVGDLQNDLSVDQEEPGLEGQALLDVLSFAQPADLDHESLLSPETIASLHRGIEDVKAGRVRKLERNRFAEADGE
jgi:hypothetical protein